MGLEHFRAGFDAETFSGRRNRVFERLDGGAMVLPASPVKFRSGDSEYRYRPDSELLYVTGMEEPGVVAVLRDHADEERFVLFVRERDAEAEQWSGTRLGPEAARDAFGADAAFPLAELEERLPGLLHGARRVNYRLGGQERVERLVVEALRWSRRRGARKGQGPRSVVDPGEILSELRVHKDPKELDCIRRAASLTVEGFRRLAEATAPGVGEWELEALLDGRFRAGGGEGPAFASIVASGGNACVLHYVANRARLSAGDLLLVDAGAEVDHYSADITRTFPVSGSFSSRQRDVYDVVDRARRAAIEAARPGAPVAGVHDAAVGVIAEGLRDLRVLAESVDQIVASEDYRAFYPHQTGHWLGLEVHDVGDYANDGSSRLLEPGMVLTVEPGLYFPPHVGDRAGPYADLGVRIEDDVLIGEDGPERLTSELPTEAEAVAALVGPPEQRP
jgi:Xaa-Pro aminopeptidase